MPLSGEEKEQIETKLRELIPLYLRVKKYIIASEKAATENKLSMPAINELRNAFDHEMRAHAVLLGLAPVPPEAKMSPLDYCMTNISKAIGHVYRAGYDALDVLSLAITTDIKKNIDSVSRATIVTVFPDYSRDIRIPLETAMNTCDQAKTMKDVEADGAGQQHFVKYEGAIVELLSVKEKLYAHLPELNTVEQERKALDEEKEKKLSHHFKRERNIAIGVAIILAIISFISGYFFWKNPPDSGKPNAIVPSTTANSH